MRLRELYASKDPVFSFEFFLPKTEAGFAAFRDTVAELKTLSPSFVSLTYGAMGSQRQHEQTVKTAGMLKNEFGLETAAHLTGISHTKAELDAVLDAIAGEGIENIVALRGDLPKDGSAKPAAERDFAHGVDVVRHVGARGGFDMAVAGYPEGHPEAVSLDDDLEHLKSKVDAGGAVVITQLFFNNADYFSFVERARKAGITVPIVPGIMPVTNVKQLERFTAMCGAKIPVRMHRSLSSLAEDPQAVIDYGVDFAVRQCKELLLEGAPGLHFYTLNKTHSTFRIVEHLRGQSLP